ncbi:MAG: GNAT family N-acetyltransferase [Thermoflexales bacterium]
MTTSSTLGAQALASPAPWSGPGLVRPATRRDRAPVRRIERACLGGASWLFGLWHRTGWTDTWTLVAERDGDAVGYLIAYPMLWRGALEMYVGGMGVLPVYRHNGYASRLLRFTLDAHPRLWLHVRASNTAAIALYRKSGMIDAGRISGFYVNGDIAVVMATAKMTL